MQCVQYNIQKTNVMGYKYGNKKANYRYTFIPV